VGGMTLAMRSMPPLTAAVTGHLSHPASRGGARFTSQSRSSCVCAVWLRPDYATGTHAIR
jgi:hypothetical protein